jgi:hypothetical protein
MAKSKRTKTKGTRYAISVSGETYDRLRAAVPHGGMASFVDEAVATALDDPATTARLVVQCRRGEDYS